MLADAVAYARGKGVLVVAAAGNDGGTVGVPARLAGVLAVGAVDAALVRAPFSAGGRALDLVAPGVGILQQTLDGAGGLPIAPSRARPWRRRTSRASRRSRSPPGGRRRRSVSRACSRGRLAISGRRAGRGLRRRARAGGRGSGRPPWRYPEGMASRAPSYPQIARAQWLLGLDAPESQEEIRRAWKERVARTHPDRNAERANAATRVTAAFNQARELCEWWLEAGEPGRSRWRPRRCATPSPSASSARRRGRPSRTAPRSAQATSLCGAPRPRARRRAPAHGARDGHATTIASSWRTARSPPRPSSRRWPTGVPCAGSAAVPRSSALRCGRVRRAWPSWCSSSARSERSSPRCAASDRARGRAGPRLPNSATRARGGRARALPLGRGRRPPAARGAPGAHAGRLRARLRAVGGGFDRARRRRRVALGLGGRSRSAPSSA